ncbi:MAG: phosphoadenylyl-sulfate reductase [bacterium]|nr:phosphoadenylyl-sulfate reductase [bacterium]
MLARFHGRPMIATSAFGMEGCALIGMIAAQAPSFTVAYLDTGFFFPETHDLLARLRERYPHLEFVNRGTTLTPEQQAERYGDELWKRDPDLCCRLRKIDPLAEVMKEVDVWVTALRRGQSAQRAAIRNVEWDFQYDVLKISPLAGWERAEVWKYVQKHDVPYNALHERGYPSIGCTHCTQPVAGSSPGDYSRDGRWSGQGKSECGLHGYGI